MILAASPGRTSTRGHLSGCDRLHHVQDEHPALPGIGHVAGPNGEAVHGRVVEGREVVRRDEVLCQDQAETLSQRA